VPLFWSCFRWSAKNASDTITIVAVDTAPGRTTVTNTASVSSSTFDPNMANNVVSVATSVYGSQ
jgi:hypothetical protein